MAGKKLRILLVNQFAMRGGVPKAVAELANAMARRGHEVTILSQKHVPPLLKPFYDLAYKIRVVSIPDGREKPLPAGSAAFEKNYRLEPGIKVLPYKFTDKNLKIQKLRARIREMNPDVCVCPLPDSSQLVWAVTLMGSGIPYVYSEQTSPLGMEEIFWNRKGRLAAMSGADAIHLLLPSYLDSLPDFLRDRAAAIPNAASLPSAAANTAGEPGKRKKLLWLGRMHDSIKQCRMALDAFALIADKFPEWDLHVVGGGQDGEIIRTHARALEKERKLEGRIVFHGEQKDVWPFFREAQAYCFSSKFEGMPKSLVEAMASGLPAVAFAACPGVPDLIRHGENGLLAEEMDADALAGQMEILLADDELRERLGRAARKDMEAYSEQAVFDAWEELLVKTAGKKGATEMDSFYEEPFASMARLSALTRREWLWRDFGEVMPGSIESFVYWNFWYKPKIWIKLKLLARRR